MLTCRTAAIINSCVGEVLRSIPSRPITACQKNMAEFNFEVRSKQLAPALSRNKHKGQAGRIGVFGGSLEYTGAPYFSAISALKVGADLVHVFCAKGAAPVIKSYSPELIVHPLLDEEDAVKKIEPWLDRLHVVVIGPGLGREDLVFSVIGDIIDICRVQCKPLVIDADGLFLIANQPHLIKDYPPPGVILTPNIVEYERLLKAPIPNSENTMNSNFFNLGRNITILCKGESDEIKDYAKSFAVSGGGSGRRCGGQGDLLSGSLATFFVWALQQKKDDTESHDDRAMLACYSASKLTRECNARAFQKRGRSTVTSDMIEEVHAVFDDLFELK